MSDQANRVRKVTDYNVIFVQLAEGEAKVVETIGAISEQAANFARYQDAADAMKRTAPTGFVSALA